MQETKERVALVSAFASGSLAAAKFAVGVAIGSLALISDALHSLIDLGATLVTYFVVRASGRPPDEEHPYGHGKFESVAALAVTAMLFLLAGGVAVEAIARLRVGGTPVTLSAIPFVVLGIEMAINFWRARVLLKTARATKSEALEADSLHFAADFYGSIPVIVGLVLSAYGYYWADSAAAIVVAVLIAILGFRLAKRTVESLVDTAPAGVAEQIIASLRRITGVVDVERVRLRTVGPHNFVDVAIFVPRTMELDRIVQVKALVGDAVGRVVGDADTVVTANPIALDSETVTDRVMVIARNMALAIHHVTVHAIGSRLAISLDLEVDGALSLHDAHEIADRLEAAVQQELGPDVEVETHIEPLEATDRTGRDAPAARHDQVAATLAELAGEAGPIRDVHDVRVRDTEAGEIVNFHCYVNPQMTVHEVHERVDALERALRRRWPAIKRVIGHAEPRDAGAPAVSSRN